MAIVEDETLIRMVLVDSLLDDGFDVIEAIHAQDAIRFWVKKPPAFTSSLRTSTCPVK